MWVDPEEWHSVLTFDLYSYSMNLQAVLSIDIEMSGYSEILTQENCTASDKLNLILQMFSFPLFLSLYTDRIG